MKKLILKISLVTALSFGVFFGIAQEKDAELVKANAQEVKVESVVVIKKAMTEAEVKESTLTATKVFLEPMWFTYVAGAYNSTGSYTFLTDDDGEAQTECNAGVEEVCAIKVLPNGAGTAPDPAALSALQSEISAALTGEAHTDNVRLRPN